MIILNTNLFNTKDINTVGLEKATEPPVLTSHLFFGKYGQELIWSSKCSLPNPPSKSLSQEPDVYLTLDFLQPKTIPKTTKFLQLEILFWKVQYV